MQNNNFIFTFIWFTILHTNIKWYINNMVTKTILVSMRQEIRCSRCIDLRRHLWDQAWLPTNTLLGDSTCWRRSINLPVAHPEHLFDSLNNILYGDKDNTCFYGTRALSKNNWSRFMTTKRFEGYFHRFIKYFGTEAR